MMQEQIEKLALAQAIYKHFAAIVKTGDPDNLRGEVDAYYKDVWRETHARSFDVTVNGEKVGTYSMTLRPGRESEQLVWDDPDVVMDWAIDNGFIQLDEAAIMHHFRETGELPPTGEIIKLTHPASVTPSLRVDVDKVKEAVKGNLPQVIEGLLEG